MKISEIKTELGLSSLPLVKALDKAGEFTGWYRFWSFETRTCVSMHGDTVKLISENRSVDNLGLQHEKRQSESGQDYDSYRIVAYTPITPDVVL